MKSGLHPWLLSDALRAKTENVVRQFFYFFSFAACLIFLSFLPACSTAQNARAGSAHESNSSNVNVSPPPGVEPAAIEPRTGDAAVKARLDLRHIVQTLPWPGYLASVKTAATQPQTAPSPESVESTEPPLAAQQAYAEGREEWLNRRGFDAIRSLQTAESLDPDNADILRLLGQIYTLSGNKVRGGYYLEKAVRANPKDIESLFMLGQFALEQGRWDAAIVTYAYVISQRAEAADVDPAMWPLISFSLAGALDREGYDAAAIEQYRIATGINESFGRTTRFGREVAFLSRQRSAVWRALGDAYNRLNDPAAALDAYHRAVELAAKDDSDSDSDSDLNSRIVYTLLRLGRRDAAVDAGVEYVHTSQASGASLELLKYLAGNGADKARLSSRLEKAYPRGDRPPQMTIALASLLGGAKGRALLESHLAAKPTDRLVFEELARQSFADKTDPTAVPEAIRAGVTAIAAKPALARDYTSVLVDSTDDQDKLRPSLNLPNATPREQAILHYIRGRSFVKTGQVKEAIQELDAGGTGANGLTASRVDEARLLLASNQAEKAEKILDSLGDRDDAEVTGLKVQVLAQTGRLADALALLEKMIAREPLNTDLMLEKATIQRVMNDPVGAERTLDDALDVRPTSEAIYAALFNLYDSNQSPPDGVQQYQRLMMRMLRTIPQSRLARLKNATDVLAASRQFDKAEEILKTLIAENPKDYEATDQLLDVMVSAGQKDDADAYIRKRLAESPRDMQLFRVAYAHYRNRVKEPQRADEITEQFFLGQPPSADRSIELARVYSRTHRIPQAEQELRHAIDQFPDRKVDLASELGEFYERIGQRDRYESVMTDLLKEFPDDARVNNGLGYVWADRGIHLEQAKAMIEKAVAAEPNNAAYLDSLGWACYKLGQFDEAVKWLEKARSGADGENPVIIEHLGDAHYRDGATDKAATDWQRAQSLAAQLDPEDDSDPDMVGITQRLTAKLLAIHQGRPVPVAEVPSIPAAPKP